MSGFVIPGTAAPNNLHYSSNVKASLVEADVYNICERIKEVDPSLFIVLLAEDDKCAYAIMEHCADGTDRLVTKCLALDERIIQKCMYLRSIPFEKRFTEIEAQIDKEEAEEKERAKEEMYERVGAPMLRELQRTGFVDGNVASMTPQNATARRHRAEHAKSRLKLG